MSCLVGNVTLVDLPRARATVRGKHNPKITFCSVLAVWRENLPQIGT